MSRMLPRTGVEARSGGALLGLGLVLAAAACGGQIEGNADAMVAADAPQPAADATAFPDALAPGEDARPAPDAAPLADAGLLPPCEPALTITPAARAVGALQLVSFEAAGGTERYTFSLATDASGALVNAVTGAYLSGSRTGVVDRIRVTAADCDGEAIAEIRVVEPLIVRPAAATIRPGTRFGFQVVGGSGRTTFTLASDRSGATLTATGAYTAGSGVGLDQIRVEDLETGEIVRVELQVDASARLVADPPEVYLPVGGRFRLRTSGGSGEIALEAAPDLVLFSEGTLTGTRAGSRTLTLTDPFTHDTTPVRVTVADVQGVPGRRAGNGLLVSSVLTPGDLDGDGFPDAVFALPDHDLTANAGGVVMVYRGIRGGLQSTPAQIIGARTRGEELGRSIAVADLDGDGHLDLLVGVARADITGVDSGAVRIHPGVAGGLFAPEPSKTLSGRFAGDLFGSSIAACDFSGDGRPDLAIAARAAEDRGRTPTTNDQGGVHVFVQRPTGFRDEPDQTLWGDVPTGSGGWAGQGGLLFGMALAAGDLDGDGACDLAASSIDYDRDSANNTNDGLVYVYPGVPAMGAARGGLGAQPVLGWASTSTADVGALLGRTLVIGELTGDDRAELVIGAPQGDSGAGDNHGIVRIRSGAPLPATPITALASAQGMDWSYAHDGDQDLLGWSAAIGDLTGDGTADLVVGARQDEVMGGPDGAGTVALFPGRPGGLPVLRPTVVRGGLAGGDSFGAAVGVVGELTGDASADLFVFAISNDALGRDVGATYLLDGRLDRAPVALDFPGAPSGFEAGRGADLVGDLDGDGLADLVVGASRDNSATLGLTTGSAYFYRGTAAGFAREPTLVWREFPGHATGDLFGYAVARAGDFDGDGAEDVAIVARNDDRPATFAAADFELDPSCTGLPAANDVGAVHVFRGAQGGPAARPSFVIFGVEGGDVIEAALGGFDYDGDGLGDLVIGSPAWDTPALANAGGFALIRGRAPSADGRTRVVCALDFVHHGSEANTNLGRTFAALGDLDGDGCDDLAAGASTEDLGNADQGSVRVLYGLGTRCTAGVRMATLIGGTRSAQAGFALGSDGRDLDGDGLAELAVGIPALVSGGNTVGGARMILGAALRAAATETPVDGVSPAALTTMNGPPVLVGRTVGGGFGRAVALGDGGMWVGAPLADYAGVVASGGATFHAYVRATATFEPALRGVMGGETVRELGRIGELVMTRAGTPWVLVTGYDGQGGGVDLGSAYVLRTR